MCLLLIAHGCRSDYPLIVAANRDEFHDRPAEAIHWWSDPVVLGGRDARAGGSWFVVDKRGRFAAVTNFRDPESPEGRRSRGELPLRALAGPTVTDLEALAAEGDDYSPFNLLAGDASRVSYVSNRCASVSELPRGVHGLSNGCLNAPWPKIHRGRAALGALVQSPAEPSADQLLDRLYDRHHPRDDLLPATGVGVERERFLSPAFIISPEYGTRCSTVLMISAAGEANVTERWFDPDGEAVATYREDFTLSAEARGIAAPAG